MNAVGTPVWVALVLVFLQGLWLGLAALNNIRHAAHNRDSVMAVLSMRWLEEDAPDAFVAYRHRRWASPRVQHSIFRVLIVVECAIAVTLLAAAGALVGVLLGWVALSTATALAIGGSLAFTVLWGMFLAGGEWFVYYATPRTPQYTHFYLLLWGVGTLAVLT